MKRKLIIISASVAVLALIVVMGFYAQGGSKPTNGVTCEQTKDMPDGCKKCPDAAKCSGEKDLTASGCIGKTEKKDCSKCDKKAECAKTEACKEKKECADKSKCCDKKAEAKVCPNSTPECKKECDKK
jgi:hypothetical protein